MSSGPHEERARYTSRETSSLLTPSAVTRTIPSVSRCSNLRGRIPDGKGRDREHPFFRSLEDSKHASMRTILFDVELEATDEFGGSMKNAQDIGCWQLPPF